MTHPTSVPFTTEAAEHPFALARAFNSFDLEILDQLYEPDALFVPRPGDGVTGAERLRANAEFLALRIPIEVNPRHTLVTGDIALLIVDWVIDGIAADGSETHLEGTATDVARRGADGYWRYVIDNPFGGEEPVDRPADGRRSADTTGCPPPRTPSA